MISSCQGGWLYTMLCSHTLVLCWKPSAVVLPVRFETFVSLCSPVPRQASSVKLSASFMLSVQPFVLFIHPFMLVAVRLARHVWGFVSSSHLRGSAGFVSRLGLMYLFIFRDTVITGVTRRSAYSPRQQNSPQGYPVAMETGPPMNAQQMVTMLTASFLF